MAAPATLLATGGLAQAAGAHGGGHDGHGLAGVSSQAQDALNALFRWSHGYDARDVALMRSAFTTDSRFIFRPAGGGTPAIFEGIDAVMKLFTDSLASQNDRRRHVTTNPLVERIDRKTLKVSSYLVLIVIENDANSTLRVQATGVYRDTVVRQRDGVWRIRERDLTLDRPS